MVRSVNELRAEVHTERAKSATSHSGDESLLALTEAHMVKLLDQRDGTAAVSNIIVRASNFNNAKSHNHVLSVLMKTLQNMPVLISHPLVTSIQKILCDHTKKHRSNMMRLEEEELSLIEQRDKCKQTNYTALQHLERAQKQLEEEANAMKLRDDELDQEIEEMRRKLKVLH